MSIYLDNAATTPLDPRVLEAMMPYLTRVHGNPSSIHAQGREARSAIEKARKKVADLLHTSPSELFFTSGGTEADNTALQSAVETYGIKHLITSPIEHHAVLHTAEYLARTGKVQLHHVPLDALGRLVMEDLEALLKKFPGALVSLMHANNEIGNLNDIGAIALLCREYGALYHSDTVQTLGYYPLDLQKQKVHYLAGSAHKFNGPKGVGFLYAEGEAKLQPFVYGGAQERNMRGGTENVSGIIGLAAALELAHEEMEKKKQYLFELKKYTIAQLNTSLKGITYNGDCLSETQSHYKILNVSFPPSEVNEMLLFNLDIDKISVSGGSACASGTNVGSHVLTHLNVADERANIRFSFGMENTKQEIDVVVKKLARLYA